MRDRDDRPEDDARPWDRHRARRRDPDNRDDADDGASDPTIWGVAPVNTLPLAIAAGYVGLISVLCIPAPFAVLLGVLALRQLRRQPKTDGRVRAIFAIVMGIICMVVPVALMAVAAATGKL